MAEPMQFTSERFGVNAVGEITPDTPAEFAAFLASANLTPASNLMPGTFLWLDSPGGSVEASLVLGRMVREQGLHTMVEPGR